MQFSGKKSIGERWSGVKVNSLQYVGMFSSRVVLVEDLALILDSFWNYNKLCPLPLGSLRASRLPKLEGESGR